MILTCKSKLEIYQNLPEKKKKIWLESSSVNLKIAVKTRLFRIVANILNKSLYTKIENYKIIKKQKSHEYFPSNED